MARDTLIKDSVEVAADAIADHAEAVRNGHSQSKPNEGEWNPFADVDTVFASERPPLRIEFSVYGREAFVEARMMGADAFERYKSLGRELHFNAETKAVREVRVTEDPAEQQMVLLLSSLTDFQLWRKEPTHGGGEQYTLLMGRQANGQPLPEAVRRQLFKDMAPDFRDRLVSVCMKVNGLDPFDLPSGTPPSKPSS